MCRYFCTEFIDFMLKGRSFLEYANLFSTNDFLVFAPVLNLLLLDDNKKFLTGYQLEYQLEK